MAEGGRQGEVRHSGVIPTEGAALDKVVRAWRAPNRVLDIVDEAGPCGFGIHRHLTARGEDCVVVSPSRVPKRSGDRVKTDRRDRVTRARRHRAGELRAIHSPDATDEARRDLVRGREDAVVVATQATYRLQACLLRPGRRYPGRAGWTLPYRRWVADRSFSRAAQHITLQEYRDAIDETARRIARLTEQVRQVAPTWRWAPLVAALQARRGVAFITARGVVAELGDRTRFGHPRERMAFVGLVPSESSSGPSVRRGGITNAGNPHVRRLLAEAAWADQGVPRIGRQQRYRQEGLPKGVCDIAWNAPLRLRGRLRRLVARGTSKPKVATAIARELSGFIWAMAREVSASA